MGQQTQEGERGYHAGDPQDRPELVVGPDHDRSREPDQDSETKEAEDGLCRADLRSSRRDPGYQS